MSKAVLIPNDPITRTTEKGNAYNITFSEQNIEAMFNRHAESNTEFKLFLNLESDERFNPNFPVGSLMSELDEPLTIEL